MTSTLLAVVHAAPAVGSTILQSPSRMSSSAEMGSVESDLATDPEARAANIANAIAKSEFRPPSMGPLNRLSVILVRQPRRSTYPLR